jgi:lysophospholipase L1-like esterase
MRTRRGGLGVVLVLVVALLAGVLAAAVALGSGSESASSQGTAAGKPYNVVWISDSTGWGVASVYARRIRQDLHVKVRVHDEWVGGLPAKEILSRLRTQSDPWISLIRDAEVIVILGSPAGLEVVKGGDCVTDNKPPAQVGPQAWPKYIAALKGIYKRIFDIRKGAPVILRTYTYYVPVLFHAPADFPGVTSWDEAGILDVCTKKFEWHAWAIGQAAAAYKVPVADVYTAFNGKTHREDPVAKGYIKPDNEHPNAKGAAVIAKTLAALGYKPVTPPK